jgi:transcriptional regulator with XRE-family HTH domain
MKLDGQQIKKYRQVKGLTQKELAEKTQLNTRTIQRLENEETEPRPHTLRQIAEVLEIPINTDEESKSRHLFWSGLMNLVGLILLNFGIVFIFGYLTMDSNANMNSLFGAFLLSLIMPFVICFFTTSLSKEERLVKYGLGSWLYVLAFVVIHGPLVVIAKGLLFIVVFYSVSLYLSSGIFKYVDS